MSLAPWMFPTIHAIIANMNDSINDFEATVATIRHYQELLGEDDDAMHDYVYHHDRNILEMLNALRVIDFNDSNVRNQDDGRLVEPVGYDTLSYLLSAGNSTRPFTHDCIPKLGWIAYEVIRDNLQHNDNSQFTDRQLVIMRALLAFDDMIRRDADDNMRLKVCDTVSYYVADCNACIDSINMMLVDGLTVEYAWENLKLGTFKRLETVK